MSINGNRTHFHEGYKNTANVSVYKNNMLPNFETIKEPLERRGVTIYNASIKSRIECFQKINLEEAIDFD
jgi:hypothetical protein